LGSPTPTKNTDGVATRGFAVFGRDSTKRAPNPSYEKLALSHGNLETRLKAIDAALLQSELQKKIYADASGILANLEIALKDKRYDDSWWYDAYKTELLIAQLLDGERLKHEIEARLGEMGCQKTPRALPRGNGR
jgi:hypothetical protein